jgi:hypothetical protein
MELALSVPSIPYSAKGKIVSQVYYDASSHIVMYTDVAARATKGFLFASPSE